MIAAVRKTGAAVSLITDGDVAGVIHTAEAARPASISISASAARRKACWRPRRCAASAARCRCRLVIDTEEKRERTLKMGIKDPRKKYQIEDMVRGDCLFAATGVTAGAHAARRQVRQRHDRDRDGGDALGHRHGALDPSPSTASSKNSIWTRRGRAARYRKLRRNSRVLGPSENSCAGQQAGRARKGSSRARGVCPNSAAIEAAMPPCDLRLKGRATMPRDVHLVGSVPGANAARGVRDASARRWARASSAFPTARPASAGLDHLARNGVRRQPGA